MAISFVAAGTLGAVASGNVTPGMPSGWAADDVALMGVMTNAGNTFPAITGWTSVGTAVNSANQSTAWYWRRLAGGDSAPSFTIASGTALANTNGLYARIYALRGCVTSGTPFEAAANAGTPTSSTTPQTSSITTTVDNTLIVCIVLADDDNTWASGMPPAGWSNIGGRLASTTGGDCMVDAISIAKATAGNQAAATVGTMSAADYWRTLTLAFLPGATVVTGTGTGGASTAGSATGLRKVTGSATGSASTSAAATGTRVVTGTATGSAGTSGHATGSTNETIEGTGTGSASTAGTATGTRVVTGTGSGSAATAGTSSGVRVVPGSAAGSAVSSGSATGTRVATGTATGGSSTGGAASGIRIVVGIANGAASSTGQATGVRIVLATATGPAASGGSGSGLHVVPGQGESLSFTSGQAQGGDSQVHVAVAVCRESSAATHQDPPTRVGFREKSSITYRE